METKKSNEEFASVRAVDQAGRVVLPHELLSKLDIKPKDRVCISEREDEIIIRKYKPTCTFCGTEEILFMFKGKCICKDCVRFIYALTDSEP